MKAKIGEASAEWFMDNMDPTLVDAEGWMLYDVREEGGQYVGVTSDMRTLTINETSLNLAINAIRKFQNTPTH